MLPIIPRKCDACSAWKGERHTTAVVIDDDLTLRACDSCMESAARPGRYERNTDDASMVVAIALDSLGVWEYADHMLSDEYYGTLAVIGRWTWTQYDGFVVAEEHRDHDTAMEWVDGCEENGFGASEDDAWISCDHGGYSVSFAGKHVGTFKTERRAYAAVSVEMRRHGYYPNVWLTGEHGPSVRMVNDRVW